MMTATCPLDLEREVVRMVGVERCLVIRAPTPRPEISYNVFTFDSMEPAERWLVDSVAAARAFYRRGDKGLIFCRSHETTERIAALLDCPAFHRDERTSSEIRDIYDRFVEEDDQDLIAATSLLGAGVHIAHIRNTWHFDNPWSTVDFAQETGRAARDGKPATSYVVTWRSELDRTPKKLRYTEDTLRQWLVQQSGCRRTLIAQVLDQKPTSCILLKNANLCDHCRNALLSREPRPEHGVGFFENPELTASGPLPAPPRLSPTTSSFKPLPPGSSGLMVSLWVPFFYFGVVASIDQRRFQPCLTARSSRGDRRSEEVIISHV